MSTLLDPPESRTVPRTHTSPSAWRCAAAIARVEGARMARHPATLVGVGLTSMIAIVFFRSVAPVLHRDVATLSVVAGPLAAGVLLAAHLATSRHVRDHTRPLTTVAPVSEALRTAGLALGLLWPALIATAWLTAALAVLTVLGGIGTPHLGDALATPALVVYAGMLGIALGRWLPAPPGGLLGLIAIGMALVQLAEARSTAVRLAPWADWFPSRGLIELWPRDPWIHLAYVLLLAAAALGIAVLHTHRHAITMGFLVASIAGTAALATQLLTVWHTSATLASFEHTQRDSASFLTCTDAPPVEVCTPPAYQPWAPELAAPARATYEMLPPSAQPAQLRIEITDTWPATLMQSLPEGVRKRLNSHERDIPEGTILMPPHRNRGGADTGPLAIALETVRIGLDIGGETATTSVSGDTVIAPCTVRGQAREVVAFATAASATPSAHAALDQELQQRPYGWQGTGDSRWFADNFWIDVGWHPTTAINWSRSGATKGLRLADRLHDITVLHERWEHWTDPSTSSDELLTTFGLEPLPTPEELAQQEGIDAPDRFANSDIEPSSC